MAQREGSVYLYLFVVAGVLFLIMLVMFFLTNADKQELANRFAAKDREAQDLDRNRKKLSGDIQLLREMVAGAREGEWPDLEQFKQHFMTDELKAKAEKAINEVTADLKEPARTYDSLVAPYADLSLIFKKLIQVRDEAVVARAKADEDLLKVRQDSETNVGKFREEKQELSKQIQDLQSRIEDAENKAKVREADLITQVEKERDDGVEKEVRLKRVVAFKENEIRALQGKIDTLEKEKRLEKNIEDIAQDGTILAVQLSAGKAWIDLGRANHLATGVKFRVLQTVKGGKRIHKGTVEVRKTDENMSEVRILEEADPLNPIVKGDMIASPFYDKEAKPVFVFAGSEMESKDFTREYVVAKVVNQGGEVRNRVDNGTDFLVAMKNYESTPEYKAARELGVTIIREKDLIEYIGQ